jgi:hypothetical protein
MSKRFLELIGVAAVIAGVIVLLKLTPVTVAGQAPTSSAEPGDAAKAGPAPKTPWGEPDLQGIWTDNYQTPLQRAAKYAGKEFLTDAEVAELDRQRAAIQRREYRDRNAQGKGTEQDVAGAYNTVFESHRHTGRRTSLVVDPPEGRIPPLTPETQKRRAAYREFQVALLQATETCKNQQAAQAACRGGKYGPPSPRRAERPPIYSVDRLNRADGPEDRSLAERCMGSILPDLSGFRRIIQSPGSVSIFYDVGQGQTWQRVIPVNGTPHLPQHVRQWWGDSRGRWEGNTLVVDVTNFSSKTDFRGSRENLHLVERWTRTDADTLEYAVTIEDPTTWTKPWTVKHEMSKQNEQANRFYMEPRCHEGNYGMVGMLSDTRAVERAFAEGRGPDPATQDIALGGAGGGEDNLDPLQGAE